MAGRNRKVTAVVLAMGLSVSGCKGLSNQGLLGSLTDRKTEVAASQLPAGPIKLGSNSSVTQPFTDYVSDNRLSKPLASDSTGDDVSTAGRFRQAAQSVKQALTIEPKVISPHDPIRLSSSPDRIQPNLYRSAALLYEQQGRLDEAIDQYERLLAEDPKNRGAMVGIGRLKHRGGDLQGSIEIYELAVKEYPSDPVILNDYGLCLARAGRTNEAVVALSHAIKARPDSLLYRNNLAAILVEANRPQEAVRTLQETHSASVAHYNVAYMLQQKGKTLAATSHFSKALDADPNFEPARRMLNQLRPVIGTRPIYGSESRPDRTHSGTTQPQRLPSQHADPVPPAQPVVQNAPVIQGQPTEPSESSLTQPGVVSQRQMPSQNAAETDAPLQLIPFVVSPEMALGQSAESVSPASHQQSSADGSHSETTNHVAPVIIRLPSSQPREADQTLVPPSPTGLESPLAPVFLPIAE